MTTKLRDAILSLEKTQKIYDEAIMKIIVELETENKELKERINRRDAMIDTLTREFRVLNKRFNEHILHEEK